MDSSAHAIDLPPALPRVAQPAPANEAPAGVPRSARDYAWWALTDLSYLPVALALALLLPATRTVSVQTAVVIAAVLVAAGTVTLPLPSCSAKGLQLGFVPAVLVVPLNLVPLLVALTSLGGYLSQRRVRIGLWRSLGDSWFCVAPAVILGVTGAAAHPSWGHWPVYLAAFASEFALDIVTSSVRFAVTLGMSLSELPGTLWTYAMDAMLTPIGLGAAITAHSDPAAAVITTLSGVGVLMLLARERRARLRHEHDALHDPLTGLANRQLFDELLNTAARRCVRAGTTAAVLLLDLDGFKAINDRHGHALGDVILRQTAQRLRDTVRGEDGVARLGGDEFAVLLPEPTSASDANIVAHKLRRALSDPIAIDELEFSVVASVGVAMLSPTASAASALALADSAMYADKRSRRGQISISASLPPGA